MCVDVSVGGGSSKIKNVELGQSASLFRAESVCQQETKLIL